MPFADLLQWVSQSRKTGTLVVDGDRFKKKLYFDEGYIVASASDNPKEFLGYFLVGWCFLDEDELVELLDMQEKHGALLGELLVIIGRLSREEVVGILKAKTEECIYDLFLWPQGDFRFLENILPTKKFEPLALEVDMLILEGVRRKDEMGPIREVIGDDQWVPKLLRAVDVQGLGPTEMCLLGEINGKNSVEEIGLHCRVVPFYVLQFMYHGINNGLFDLLSPKLEEKPIPGFTSGAWKLLIAECEQALDGGDLLEAYQRLEILKTKFGDVKEAVENAGALERDIERLLDRSKLGDGSVLELSIPTDELTSLSCSPEEGFLLSRVNGSYTLAEILKMLPGSALGHRAVVDALLKRGVLAIKA